MRKSNTNKVANKRALSIFSFTQRGYALSNRLSLLFNGSEEIGPKEIKGGGLRRNVKAIFSRSKAKGANNGQSESALIFIGATGIAIRSIAPFLRDKTTDPAVIVIDERARFVISLLSGHLGGANRLAKLIATRIGATEVITTATDLAGLPCVEDIALKFSLKIENKTMIKKINARVLRGEKIVVLDANSARRRDMKGDKRLGKSFIFKSRITKEPTGPIVVVSSEIFTQKDTIYNSALRLRPREFVVGIGCRRGVTIKEIKEAYSSVLNKNKISPLSIRSLASIDIKADERGTLRLCQARDLDRLYRGKQNS